MPPCAELAASSRYGADPAAEPVEQSYRGRRLEERGARRPRRRASSARAQCASRAAVSTSCRSASSPPQGCVEEGVALAPRARSTRARRRALGHLRASARESSRGHRRLPRTARGAARRGRRVQSRFTVAVRHAENLGRLLDRRARRRSAARPPCACRASSSASSASAASISTRSTDGPVGWRERVVEGDPDRRRRLAAPRRRAWSTRIRRMARAAMAKKWARFSQAVDPLIHQPEVGLVDQGGGLQGVVGTLAAEQPGGEVAQLGVDHRQQLVGRLAATAGNVEQQSGDVAGPRRGHSRSRDWKMPGGRACRVTLQCDAGPRARLVRFLRQRHRAAL